MRNVFVSYSHRLDQDEADDFREKFGFEKRNGLLGILLPNKQHWIPARLEKNLHMGKIINMPRDYRTLENTIEDVYGLRWQQPNLRDSLRQRNSSIYT
jgi:hypothetical protein